MVATHVLDDSADFPELTVMIQMCGLFKSRRQEQQRLGRVLRWGPEKRKRWERCGARPTFYVLVHGNTVEEEMSLHRTNAVAGIEYERVTASDIIGAGGSYSLGVSDLFGASAALRRNPDGSVNKLAVYASQAKTEGAKMEAACLAMSKRIVLSLPGGGALKQGACQNGDSAAARISAVRAWIRGEKAAVADEDDKDFSADEDEACGATDDALPPGPAAKRRRKGVKIEAKALPLNLEDNDENGPDSSSGSSSTSSTSSSSSSSSSESSGDEALVRRKSAKKVFHSAGQQRRVPGAGASMAEGPAQKAAMVAAIERTELSLARAQRTKEAIAKEESALVALAPVPAPSSLAPAKESALVALAVVPAPPSLAPEEACSVATLSPVPAPRSSAPKEASSVAVLAPVPVPSFVAPKDASSVAALAPVPAPSSVAPEAAAAKASLARRPYFRGLQQRRPNPGGGGVATARASIALDLDDDSDL
eukprot:TRINITY_DN22362_c0_g1_i1.p1 TRINITY_DN22362_c0_g1~~TRINITY_DN22362_c0_g1_i1.p1  ORF type:complete len:519 (+),score=109.47 TRINITY_DN22362_c0_g1_i1:123-1559(+)